MVDRVRRVGTTVERPRHAWTQAVHGVLTYLEQVGFPAPRVVALDDRVEVLTWLEGDAGADGWGRVADERGLRSLAATLRDYHDAIRGYRAPPDAEWSSGQRTAMPGEVVCHGDPGPWNAVWRGTTVVGLFDFDHARPALPSFDVAYALEYVTPFRPDDVARADMGYVVTPDRRRRVEVFCDAYGIEVPADVVALVADQQRATLATCADLAGRGVEPQATWRAEGYLEACADRIAWTESLDLGTSASG